MFLRWSTFDIQKKNTQHKNIKGGKKPQTTPRSCDQKGSAPCWAEGVGQPGWCDGLEVDWFLVDVFFFLPPGFFLVFDVVTFWKSVKVTYFAKWRLQSQTSQTPRVVWKKMESWKLGKLWGIWRNVKGRGSFLGRRCEDVRMWGLGWRSREYTESRIDRNRLNRRRYSKVILWPFYQGKSNLLIEIRMKRGNLFLKLQTIHFI